MYLLEYRSLSVGFNFVQWVAAYRPLEMQLVAVRRSAIRLFDPDF